MKKLVLLLAVVFSVSMFSCGGGESTEATDSVAADTVEAVEEEAVAADSVAADTVVVEEAAAVVAE